MSQSAAGNANAAATAAWVPLESNPAVINEYVWKLGCSRDWAFTDIWGLDEALLAMLPQPVRAVILLFPVTTVYERYRLEEETCVTAPPADCCWYTRQTIPNACGTIAVLHALANNQPEPIQIASDSALGRLFSSTASMSADQRARALELNDELRTAHHSSALQGQTSAPDADTDVDLHFVAFVQRNGRLLELDGRKKCPIDHGPSTDDAFLKDAARIVQEFMQRDADNVQFTMLALAPNQGDDD